MHAILAMRLLQMRTLATETLDLLAIKVVPQEWVETLATVRKN